MSQQLRSATERAPGDERAGAAGERFARALVAKDAAALRAILADPIDFQALTPGRHWQASAPGEVVDEIVLGKWFEPGDDIRNLESVSSSQLPGREHVSYLLRVGNAEGDFLVEQQAYYNTEGARITWMRVLCSGYRPLEET